MAAELARKALGASAVRGCFVRGATEGRSVFCFEAGERAVVVKFVGDSAGAQTVQGMKSLERAVSGSPVSALRVPRVLDWDPDAKAMLLERLPGRPASRSPDPLQARLAGRALEELHGLGPDPEVRRYGLDDRRALRIDPWVTEVAAARPSARRAIESALDLLAVAERAWQGKLRECFVHGDFHLRQLLFDRTRVCVLDWDDMGIGDPAYDVGYMHAYLESHLDAGAAGPLVQAFTDGYGALDADFQARVAVYRVFNQLRRACRRFRLREDGWRDEMCRMLDGLGPAIAVAAKRLPEAG